MQYPMSDAHIPRNVTMHHITATTALVTYGYQASVYGQIEERLTKALNAGYTLNKLTTSTLTAMRGFMCLY